MMEKKMSNESGNSALLLRYREVLIEAYELGEDIKILYSIIPPTVFTQGNSGTLRLSLNVHGLQVVKTVE
jgi:phage head maturation protease